MKQVLIFAGTTEGRRLTEELYEADIPVTVCVATEYGETLLPEGEGIIRRTGRLDEGQMEALMKEGNFSCVVDATHPYAAVVSNNIREAAAGTGLSYLRLLREDVKTEFSEQVVFVESVKEAVSYLAGREGKILASTGSKELSEYAVLPDYKSRVFARVLSTEESVRLAGSLGFAGRNLICMQGPFSEELNYATMKEYGISWLVTKASGRAGGYKEKLRAAKRAGVGVVVVGRPWEEASGLSFSQVKRQVFAFFGKEYQEKRCVSLASLGPGAVSLMTEEARAAFSACDLIIGAGRMVEALSGFGKPAFSAYKETEIIQFLEEHGEYVRPLVAFSGDLGFYSGAKRLLPLLKERGFEVICLPGISSLAYLAAREGKPWDHAKLMSVHGRSENLIRAVKEHNRVFTLLGGEGSVEDLCRELLFYGLSQVELTIGEDLSYETERISRGFPKELLGQKFGALAAALLENPEGGMERVTHGIPDEEFIRGEVPMTKYEVRSVSLSRLELKKNSVVYDIGAGTGSVSVEAALQASEGLVYAIERKPEAAKLIGENKRKFALPNLEVVEGAAPEALKGLAVPTHAFIGGSAGNLKEIVRVLLEKNPQVRVVINAIALETVAEASGLLKEIPIKDVSVSQVMASRGKRLGGYELMTGMNPVYIISFTGKGDS
ncbi:MAG: precorrin-6A reductase [Lachnospiraceae bacterium]|nr:precorrin-6A reductase [Lachnospiraceae bacterium]